MRAFVRLLDEGTDVWREIDIDHVEDELYRVGGNEPDDEDWELKPGTVVRLIEKELSEGPALVAVSA